MWDNTNYDTARAGILEAASKGEGFGPSPYSPEGLANAWYNQIANRDFVTTGRVSTAYSVRSNRDANGAIPMQIISGVTSIKRGDLVIWGITTDFPNGFAGFADQDYISGQGTIPVLSQRNRVADVQITPTFGIIGAFHYRNWGGSNPDPGPDPGPEPAPGGQLNRSNTNIVILNRSRQIRVYGIR